MINLMESSRMTCDYPRIIFFISYLNLLFKKPMTSRIKTLIHFDYLKKIIISDLFFNRGEQMSRPKSDESTGQ